MGYSLYWTYNKDSLSSKFSQAFLSKAKKIIEKARKAKIGFGDWEGNPITDDTIISDTNIRFNGIYPDSCETFFLRPKAGAYNFDVCKTRGNPYGAICMALLELALNQNIITEWSSDGGPEDITTREIYEKVYKQKEISNED